MASIHIDNQQISAETEEKGEEYNRHFNGRKILPKDVIQTKEITTVHTQRAFTSVKGFHDLVLPWHSMCSKTGSKSK